MKTRGYLFLIGFGVFLMGIGIACNIGVTSTVQPTQPLPQSTPTLQDSSSNNTGNNSAPVIFTDQSKFYQIEIPSDWIHTSNSGAHAYLDQFKSPDGNALVENISYNDGKPFTGADNSRMALHLLHQFYSSTGKEGDVRINDDKIMPDGSERLTWTSKGRGFSGLSYFRVRDGVDFTMFTVEWANGYESQYTDVLNKIYASYKVP